MKNNYLECGKIVNTHGVRGLMRVMHYCNSEEDFCALPTVYTEKGGVYTPYKVLSAAPHGTVILLSLDSIDNIDKAMPLKNQIIYCDRNDIALDEGDVFVADIIGLDVIDADTGKVYGKVTDVTNSGAQDNYVVKTKGGEAYIPVVPEFVTKVDTERGVFIRPIEGMLPDEV